MTRPLLTAGLLAGLSACDAAPEEVNTQLPRSGPPAVSKNPEGTWVETFDHRDQMAALEGVAVVDSNRGLLTLPVEALPTLPPDGFVTLSADNAEDGLVGGLEVILEPSEAVFAPDALEIRATERVVLDGYVRAGAGGLVVAAGQRIEISGRLESDGPIELFITEPDGELLIEGEVVALSDLYGEGTPEISIGGRGHVTVRGFVGVVAGGARSPEEPCLNEPAISMAVYGDVLVQGPLARIEAGPCGSVGVSTTGDITIGTGVALRDRARWRVGAADITIDTLSELALGELNVVAEEVLSLGPGSVVSAGGRELAAVAKRVELGASSALLAQGVGGTSLRLEAAEGLTVDGGARVVSVTPSCGLSQVLVRVAGPLIGTGPSLFDAAERPPQCPEAMLNQVAMSAHRFEGEPPDLGRFPRPDAPRVDPDLTVSVPAIAAKRTGRWVSQPIFVGENARLDLVDLAAVTPRGTEVQVSVGTPDEGEPFIVHTEPGSWFGREEGTWVIIRVDLRGRLYDAPVVDHLVVRW